MKILKEFLSPFDIGVYTGLLMWAYMQAAGSWWGFLLAVLINMIFRKLNEKCWKWEAPDEKNDFYL
jgi:putative Mn2+ efflux pump MntP